jgi:hypothetical protein
MLRPWGTATAFKPAQAGIKRNSEGNTADIGKQLLNCDYRQSSSFVNSKLRQMKFAGHGDLS